MIVENYVDRWLPPDFNMRPVKEHATISKRAYGRLMREARKHFDGLGIDFDQYDEGKAIFHDMIVAQVEWTHKISGRQLKLLEIWFDRKTGAINQCGQNYGDIVS